MPKKKARKRYPKTERDIERAAQAVREKRMFLAKHKLKSGCADCGYRHHSVALEFHHVDGPKLGVMSILTRKSWAVIKAEMAKCIVLCANCHRVRSYRVQWPDGVAPFREAWEPW
jgi:hypothetical protein